MNGDLISRSALLEKTIGVVVYDEGGWDCNVRAVPDYVVEKAPAVDAVAVVRCKDCKCNNAEKALRKGGIWCDYWGTDPDPDDFCKRGERRADDATD